MQPDVGVRNRHRAEIADHNLRREELTEEEEEAEEEELTSKDTSLKSRPSANVRDRIGDDDDDDDDDDDSVASFSGFCEFTRGPLQLMHLRGGGLSSNRRGSNSI